jgi:hypothetical protein
MLILHQIWVPPQQSLDMVKHYMQYVQEAPQDESIASVVSMGVFSDETGFRVVTIKKVVSGKMEKAITTTARFDMELAKKIEGYRFKVEPLMELDEALGVIGMKLG